MTDDNRYTVSVSLTDDNVRRAVSMADGAALKVRVAGTIAAVRARIAGGATLFERAVVDKERDQALVEFTLDALELDRWTKQPVVVIEAREVLAAHHRSATHEAPWKPLATLCVRGSRARAALLACGSIAAILALVWALVFPLAASRARQIADIVSGVASLLALLAVLLFSRETYAPRVAIALTATLLVGSVWSWNNSAIVASLGDGRSSSGVTIPPRTSRWMRGEVIVEEASARVRGVRFDRASRCELREWRWPRFTIGEQRVALSSQRWLDITVGDASILGIGENVECDSQGHCCAALRDERITAGLRTTEPNAVAQAEVELRAGPATELDVHRALGGEVELRLPTRDRMESIELENPRLPQVRLHFRPREGHRALLVGRLFDGWRGVARWSTRDRASFECARGASALDVFHVVRSTIDRIEGRQWSVDFTRSVRGVACRFVDWNEQNETVTVVLGAGVRSGVFTEAQHWSLNAASMSPDWTQIRLVRRDEAGRETLLTETTRPAIDQEEMAVIPLTLTGPFELATEVRLRWPGRTIPLWRRRNPGAPVALLTLPRRVLEAMRGRYWFEVFDGAPTPSVRTAALVRREREYVLEEVSEPVAPECCRTNGVLSFCDDVSLMTRLPPRRVALPGVEAENCGAMFELSSSAVIRDPIRRPSPAR